MPRRTSTQGAGFKQVMRGLAKLAKPVGRAARKSKIASKFLKNQKDPRLNFAGEVVAALGYGRKTTRRKTTRRKKRTTRRRGAGLKPAGAGRKKKKAVYP